MREYTLKGRDMYADLEKIEARGKRKKEKKKGFSIFGKKGEQKEPEPSPASEPAIEPEPEAAAEIAPPAEGDVEYAPADDEEASAEI